MSKILKVSESNYRIKVQDTGTITLDTGDSVGGVLITGNLTVLGTTTTIDTANMTIEDNIILLNKGETQAGITEGTSGLEIARGSLPNAQFLFDESVQHFDQIADTDVDGTFVLKTANGNISGLQVGTISIDGARPADLIFDLQNTNRVLKVQNANGGEYEALLLPLTDPDRDDYLTTRRFVTDYVEAGTETPGMADVDKIYYRSPLDGLIKTKVQSYPTDIEFLVQNSLRAKVDQYGVYVDNIKLAGNTITNTTAADLILTAANNYVRTDAIFELKNQNSDVVSPNTGWIKIYTKAAEGPGRTGIYFTNDTDYDNESYNNDELVSRNRAVLLSILL